MRQLIEDIENLAVETNATNEDERSARSGGCCLGVKEARQRSEMNLELPQQIQLDERKEPKQTVGHRLIPRHSEFREDDVRRQ
jgi:hypothetical protein